MGSELKISIGPYIIIKGVKEKTKMISKKVCPNNHFLKNENDKFCSECGENITNKDILQTTLIKPFQYYNDIFSDDKLCFNEYKNNYYKKGGDLIEYYSVVFPNKYPPGKIQSPIDTNNIDLYNKQELQKEQIDWMLENYSKELDVLKNAFGEENFSIHWGIISYWN